MAERQMPRKVDISDPNGAESERKNEKIITGSVQTRKKNAGQKFADVFIAEDMSSVKNYILMDVILPSAKKAIYDIVIGGLSMALFGERGSSGKDRNSGISVSYRDYYSTKERKPTQVVRSVYTFDDILLETRADAEDVLDRMIENVEQYGSVSVADMYDMVGITGNFTDNKYGWYDLRSAHIERTREGCYVIRLPKVLPLK